VDAFQGAYDLKRIFTPKAVLPQQLGRVVGRGYLASSQARTFVDNWIPSATAQPSATRTTHLHAGQRDRWPAHGFAQVYSGYEFTNTNAGAPNAAPHTACYTTGWKCQPRLAADRPHGRLRNAVAARPSPTGGPTAHAIASAAAQGYVASTTRPPLSRTFTTSLRAPLLRRPAPRYDLRVASTAPSPATIGLQRRIALYQAGPAPRTPAARCVPQSPTGLNISPRRGMKRRCVGDGMDRDGGQEHAGEPGDEHDGRPP